MSTIGYATLQIIPSIEGLANAVSTQVGAPLVSAGKKAGADMGKAVGDGLASAKAAVESASQKLADARRKEMDAADKVGVAEAKLQTLRDKGVTDAGRLAAAEAAVAKAKRDSEAATGKAATAATQLTRAEEAATTASTNLSTESARAADNVEEVGKKSLISGDNLVKFGAMAAAGVAAAGAALFKVGSDFAEMSNSIRIGTGASGEALGGLVDVAKNLGKQVPASFSDIGTTVADLNTRLGLTGAPLQTLAAQFLELGNMGIDADVNNVSAAFQAWGVTGEGTSKALDELFQVSQATGVSVDALAVSATKGGPALRQFGFGVGDSAALVGTLDKAGLDADKTLGSMSKALVKFADDGRKPQEALYGTVVEIEKFLESGNEVGALDLAGSLFGTKGAPQFLDAVRNGTLSVDDFVSATGATSDTILGLADETRTFSDQWVMFKNEALLAIEPLATRVFGVITEGMGWFKDNAVPAISEFGDTVSRIFQSDTVTGFLDTVVPKVQSFATTAQDLATTALPVLRDVLITVKDVFVDVASAVGNVVGWFSDHEVAAGVLASVITIGLLPALTSMTVGFATSAGSAVASGVTITGVWISTQASAVTSAATQVAAQYRTVAGWVATAASALTSGAIIVGQYVAAGASATLQAGISAAAWVASSARTVGALAAQGAAFIAQKIAMGAGAIATGIMTAAQWALNAAMSANPIGLIVVALGALVAAVVVAYQNSETFRNIVQAAWQGIQDAVSFAWNNIISPVLGFFGDKISQVGTVVTFFYDNVVRPYFGLVGTVISTVVDGAKSAFGSFTDALGKVGNFFTSTVEGIDNKWSSLRGLLAKPINFMINTVWNDGILKAWNMASGLIGMEPTERLPSIPEHATGGRISGPGTGTSDDVLMWGSNNEHMLTAREVQLAGGHNAVYAIRDMIMRGVPFSWDGGQIIRDLGRDNVNAYGAQVASKGVGNVDPQGMFDWMLPKYKDGGEIRPLWESQLENGHRAAKMRNGNPYTWGFEDCSGYMSAIADAIINGGNGKWSWATGSFPGGQPWVPGLGQGFSVGVHDNPGGPGGGHTAGTLTGVGPYSTTNVESGGGHGYVAYGGPAAGADSGQFVGVSPGQYHLAIGADGAFESGGGGGGPSPEQKQDFLQRKIAEIFDKGLNPIKDSIAGAIGSPPPEALGIPPKFLDKGRDMVSGYLAEKVLGLGELLSGAWDKAKDLGSKLTFGLFDQGGLASGTGFMPKNVIAPERVLSPAETKAWELLVPHLVSLAPALEHFESVVTSPAFTSAQSLLVDGQFTPGLRESFGVEESSPIVNAVLGVRDQLKGIVPDLFGTPEMAGAESFGAVEPPASSEPVGGSGVADAYGDGTQASPEGDKWAEWANGLNEDVKGLFSKENLEEMLSTVVGVGLGGYRGGGDTFNLNGNSDTQVAKVIQRNQRRRSLASQRSGGFGR